MAKYHIYGIGNALVDKEFEVTDEFFAANNIEKGQMTLIDEDQQTALKNVPVVAARPTPSLQHNI